MNYDVTVIGEIYLDHVFSGFSGWPEPDTEIFTKNYHWELGGGAVNTACALSRLGRTVRLIGVVGQNQYPEIEGRLAQFDISGSGLVTREMQTGVTVSVSIADERTMFSYQGANELLSELLETDTTLLQAAALSKHVHLALPLAGSSAAQILTALRAHGATLSLDVGHQVEWLRASSSLDMLRAVDFLMPNAKEAQIMHGSVDEYLQFCREIGCDAVVKLGAAGAVMLSEGQIVRTSAPEVQVAGTTGAGDAFDAGFIDGLLAGVSAKERLEEACICGALSTRSAGSLESLPSKEEIAALRRTHVA